VWLDSGVVVELGVFGSGKRKTEDSGANQPFLSQATPHYFITMHLTSYLEIFLASRQASDGAEIS